MSEILHTGADFFDALDEYVQAVARAAHKAHQEGERALHDEVRRTARSHPRWRSLEADIELWHEDGETHIGVRNPRSVQAAMNAEYGDADNPPAPVLRVMPTAVRRAEDRMDEVLSSELQIPRHR